MNGNAALDLTMARLVRTQASVRANVLLEMQLAQDNAKERLGILPWFLFTDYTNAGFVTVANQDYVELPADFLELDDEKSAFYWKDTNITSPDQWREIKRDPFPTMKQRYFEQVAGDPKLFDIIGSRIYMRPIPDAVRELRLLYYKKDASPADAATENLWLKDAANWLIGEAGFAMATMHTRDEAAAVGFEAMRKAASEGLFRRHNAWLFTSTDYSMGDS
jgi:hypothetical protein